MNSSQPNLSSISRWAMVAAILAGCLSANTIASSKRRNISSSIPTQTAAALPVGVKAVWEIDKAHREPTATRERICLNGLWRWRPAGAREAVVPTGGWGYFKVPGCWPGITDYMQKDCQSVYAHPDWKGDRLGSVTSAWYQREITIPASWKGRRIAIYAEYVNSFASVLVDGKPAGDIKFPASDVDVTAFCRPGARHLLSLLVTAMPLKSVMLTYTDTNAARELRGAVERRGLCGDVWLVSEPKTARIADLKVDTSIRRGEITFTGNLKGLEDRHYIVQAEVRDHGRIVRKFVLPIVTLRGSNIPEYHLSLVGKWKPDRLWDIHSPQNKLTAQVSLIDASGKVCDTAQPISFGFREFWIKGRDFYLNGSRIFLSSVPLDNAQVGAAWASYDGARESLERLKSFGINFVYTHNYSCEPGTHLSFEEILRAADDVGMLVSLSQPHFSSYDWKAPSADQTNGYARHADFYVRAAGSHPSVVAYAMSHNATSYDEAKNPDMIDGIQDPRDNWSQNNSRLALRAEAIVKQLDPSRIVYHHSSGNLGAMYTENFYVNFAPPQELDDWFEHWATKGVKPLFLCEYGCPFSWDWAMYRGWYKGKREWGSANVPWELCVAEWNAQFVGDRAYKISEAEKRDLRWEAQQFRSGREGWHRWDYPVPIGSSAFDERNEIFARYITDNWRAFRTWGVSAISPWEYAIYWKLRPEVDRRRKELSVDWERLQRPGFSPDYVDSQYETMECSYKRSDWIPNQAAQALYRNNMPLLAYIGGKPSRFTSKDHNFLPGDTVEKQLIIINNSRKPATYVARCSLDLPKPVAVSSARSVTTGEQVRIPLQFRLPERLAPGQYQIRANVRFADGEVQQDSFMIDVLRRPALNSIMSLSEIALFDPLGETTRLLDALGVKYHRVEASTDLTRFTLLIIGKKAIGLTNPVPDMRRIRNGLRVIVFEQTAEALEQRLGFRVAEYGLREVFRSVGGHTLLRHLGVREGRRIHDWRGVATLSQPRLRYTLRPMYGPMVKWCGMDVPRVWRCGNQGSVASVLIEKPARGDVLPILVGGFALQYMGLFEFHEGKGKAIFCQMDVTGRTESDPDAITLVRNILRYSCEEALQPQRKVAYVGESAGHAHLRASGIDVSSEKTELNPQFDLLVIGPRSADRLSYEYVDAWRRRGGHIMAVGLGKTEVGALFPKAIVMQGVKTFTPDQVEVREREYFVGQLPLGEVGWWQAGFGSADTRTSDPRQIPLITDAPHTYGDGMLATFDNARIVFCQLVPWQFDTSKRNQKRTFRRTSFLLTRLLCNLGAASTSRLLDDFVKPVESGEKRWLHGLYLDTPEEWDDPYRFFPW